MWRHEDRLVVYAEIDLVTLVDWSLLNQALHSQENCRNE